MTKKLLVWTLATIPLATVSLAADAQQQAGNRHDSCCYDESR